MSNNLDSACSQLFGKVPTDAELIEAITKSELWIKSYDYTKTELIVYKGVKDIDMSINAYKFEAIKLYVIELGEVLIANKIKYDLPFMISEINRANDEGDLCIYLSVLHILLLEINQVIPAYTLKLVQGFYEYEVEQDSHIYYLSKLIGNLNTRIKCAHAFVKFPNGFIEDSAFHLDNYEYIECDAIIEGFVPDEIKLAGYEEGPETIRTYAERFAKRAGMPMGIWMGNHMECLKKVVGKEDFEYI